MSFNFTGKVVLVTGSSSGIGEDAVISFARSGAQVVVTGRNESRVKEVAEKCRKVSPTSLDALALVADVSKDEDCAMVVEMIIQKFKQLDVLVNNAGIFEQSKIASDNLMSVYDNIFRTNVRSVLLLTKLAAPHLTMTKGVIINISSVAAKRASDFSPVYSMSKSAVDMLTKCACVELGPSGVRVVSINPGAVETPIFDTLKVPLDQFKALIAQTYPLGRVGHVSDTSAAILFAASDAASFISGSTIDVDGGSLAGTPMQKMFNN